jgi:hypothetical protein
MPTPMFWLQSNTCRVVGAVGRDFRRGSGGEWVRGSHGDGRNGHNKRNNLNERFAMMRRSRGCGARAVAARVSSGRSVRAGRAAGHLSSAGSIGRNAKHRRDASLSTYRKWTRP